MTINKTKLKKIIKEEIKRTLNEGSDQKTWFTVQGKHDNYKGRGGWKDLATIELPASFIIPHNNDVLFTKLTEEGIAYVTEKVSSYSTEPGKNQILPRVEPNVIPWAATAPAEEEVQSKGDIRQKYASQNR